MNAFQKYAPANLITGNRFQDGAENIDHSRPYASVGITACAEMQFPGVDASSLMKRSAGFVYVLSTPYGWYKIGKSIDVSERLKQISPKMPFTVEVAHVISTNNHSVTEMVLHAVFSEKRTNGEWFKLDLDDLVWLKSITDINWRTGEEETGF